MSLPPVEIPLGAMRLNSDSQKLEYWMGSAWMQIQTFSPNLNGGARGVMGGGYGGANVNVIDYFTISTAGNATDFGDLLYKANRNAAWSSSIRGYWGGGAPAAPNTINDIVFSSTGDATDFGDMDNGFLYGAGCSSATRGTIALGDIGSGASDKISYLTLSNTGA